MPHITPSETKEYLASPDVLLESLNDTASEAVELLQRWNDRLVFPLTELPKRYLRGDLGIILQGVAKEARIGFREFSLLVQSDLFGKAMQGRRDGEVHQCGGIDDIQLPMLIESVHIVNDAQEMVSGVVPSVVRLQVADKTADFPVANSLYFSVISGNFSFTPWLRFANWKFDEPRAVATGILARELPDDVIENGPQVVNRFPGEHGEAQRDHLASMIVNRFLPELVIKLGENWVLAILNEGVDLSFQIQDVLIGPF